MSPWEMLEELAAFVAWAGLLWTLPVNLASFTVDVLRIWMPGAAGLGGLYLVLVWPVVYIAAIASIISVRRRPWLCVLAVIQAAAVHYWLAGRV